MAISPIRVPITPVRPVTSAATILALNSQNCHRSFCSFRIAARNSASAFVVNCLLPVYMDVSHGSNSPKFGVGILYRYANSNRYDTILSVMSSSADVLSRSISSIIFELSAVSPYPARAGCATVAGSRRMRLAPLGMMPAVSWS